MATEPVSDICGVLAVVGTAAEVVKAADAVDIAWEAVATGTVLPAEIYWYFSELIIGWVFWGK